MPGEDRRMENREPGSKKAREEWGGLGAEQSVSSRFVPPER